MKYHDSDYVNLSTFKLFSQNVRPIINARYPKLPTQKIMTLMAAYWREFLELKSIQNSSNNSLTELNNDRDGHDRMEIDEPRSSRSRRRRTAIQDDTDQDDVSIEQQQQQQDDDDNLTASPRSSSSRNNNNNKKIPSLKIKLQKDQAIAAATISSKEQGNDDEEIKITKKSNRQRKRKRRDDEDPSNESDAEFEAMLVQSEMNEEDEHT